MLRRTKTIQLKADNDVGADTLADTGTDGAGASRDHFGVPQQPSIQPLDIERRQGGDRRVSQEAMRTEFQRSLELAEQHGNPVPGARASGWSTGTKFRIALVALALIAGGAAAWLATQHEAPPAPVQVATPAPPPAPPMTRVLVAKRTIGLGDRVSADTVEWQAWPAAAIRSDYVTDAQTPDALTAMNGDIAREQFFAGEPILPSKLAQPGQGYLSAVLEPGMRGVSVSVTADAASGGFIVPDDHVDVILTRTTTEGQVSQTILSNVRVLAIGNQLGTADGGAPADPKSEAFANTAIATLALDSAEAEVIINSQSAGKLSLVLRSVTDFGEKDTAAEAAANQSIRMTSPFWTAHPTTSNGMGVIGGPTTTALPR